jgi:hypothetical protein
VLRQAERIREAERLTASLGRLPTAIEVALIEQMSALWSKPVHCEPRVSRRGPLVSLPDRPHDETPATTILDACSDPVLFPGWFRDRGTWRAWFARELARVKRVN